MKGHVPIDPLAVTGLGMVSSLGHTAASSCAAARAGMSRATELKAVSFEAEAAFGRETIDGPPAVFGHVVQGIADGFVGVAQAALLGAAALKNLLAQRPLSDDDLARTGLWLNVSNHFVQDVWARSPADVQATPSAVWRRTCARLLGLLCEAAGLSSIPASQRCLQHGGNAGFAGVVRDAAAMVSQGHLDRCLVGGVDARTGADFLWAAATANILRTVDNPVGLIPGEAAAFCLLERPSDASRQGLAVHSLVTGVHSDKESSDLLGDEPPTGRALERVLRAAFQGRRAPGFLIGDLNGTQRRAMQWGSAQVLLRRTRDLTGVPSWLPASSFGDTGAAAGAVGAAVAVRAFERGYAPADEAVVWLSSESGETSTITIRASEG